MTTHEWERVERDRCNRDLVYKFFSQPDCAERKSFLASIEHYMREQSYHAINNQRDTYFKEKFEQVWGLAHRDDIVGRHVQLFLMFVAFVAYREIVTHELLPPPPDADDPNAGPDLAKVDRTGFSAFVERELMPWWQEVCQGRELDLLCSPGILAARYVALYANSSAPYPKR